MPIRPALFAAVLMAGPALSPPALAHEGRDLRLAGAPQTRDAGRDHGQECWAQVKYPARYAPPPTGPEYVWRRTPGPPGSPGPIWCLTVQPFPDRPTMVEPERLGWVRVVCNDASAAPQVAAVQRRLHERGFYRGPMDGDYDASTASAVRRFQDARRIDHHGYLSFETLAALDCPPPCPPLGPPLGPPPPAYRPWLTTFDTGYISWPGKVRY